MNSPAKKLVVALVLIGSGVGMSMHGCGLYADAKSSAEWPTVSGQVVSSEVAKERDITSKGRNKFKYSPNVVYSYEVAGTAYQSNRLELIRTTSKNSMDVRKIIAGFRPGDSVLVHYDPRDPGSAVLRAGVSWKNYLFLLIGPGLLISGIAVLFSKR